MLCHSLDVSVCNDKHTSVSSIMRKKTGYFVLTPNCEVTNENKRKVSWS